MNRREFLKRMAMLGLAVPSTRTIVDMGANLWREPERPLFAEWKPNSCVTLTPLSTSTASATRQWKRHGNSIRFNIEGQPVAGGELKKLKCVLVRYDERQRRFVMEEM